MYLLFHPVLRYAEVPLISESNAYGLHFLLTHILKFLDGENIVPLMIIPI